jgi:hypothetical protein
MMTKSDLPSFCLLCFGLLNTLDSAWQLSSQSLAASLYGLAGAEYWFTLIATLLLLLAFHLLHGLPLLSALLIDLSPHLRARSTSPARTLAALSVTLPAFLLYRLTLLRMFPLPLPWSTLVIVVLPGCALVLTILSYGLLLMAASLKLQADDTVR